MLTVGVSVCHILRVSNSQGDRGPTGSAAQDPDDEACSDRRFDSHWQPWTGECRETVKLEIVQDNGMAASGKS